MFLFKKWTTIFTDTNFNFNDLMYFWSRRIEATKYASCIIKKKNLFTYNNIEQLSLSFNGRYMIIF